MQKKFVVFSIFLSLIFINFQAQASNYHPWVYRIIKTVNLNLDDIARTQPNVLEHEQAGSLVKFIMMIKERGTDINRENAVDNAAYNSALIFVAITPLISIKHSHEEKEEILETADYEAVKYAFDVAGEARDMLIRYALRQQNYAGGDGPKENIVLYSLDISSLEEALAKVQQAQVKLNQILANAPSEIKIKLKLPK